MTAWNLWQAAQLQQQKDEQMGRMPVVGNDCVGALEFGAHLLRYLPLNHRVTAFMLLGCSGALVNNAR